MSTQCWVHTAHFAHAWSQGCSHRLSVDDSKRCHGHCWCCRLGCTAHQGEHMLQCVDQYLLRIICKQAAHMPTKAEEWQHLLDQLPPQRNTLIAVQSVLYLFA
eukprot:6467139-Amphidinium_carterae.1